MNATERVDLERVCAEALALPSDRRAAFVEERCTDVRVRDEVLRTLRRRELGRRPPASVDVGAVLAERYELGERLGAGAFGAVHRARDLVTGDVVAVKILNLTGDVERRFLRREVGVLRRTHVPGVVEMLDEWADGVRAFVVMRLVEGVAFPALPGPERPTWDALAPRAVALLEALGRLHWLGVLHRDLKPENVLVGADGRVTIVDLGVARDFEAFGEAAPGYVVGTPAYLAPERLIGGPATTATDLYAAGVMLYEALAGRPPRATRDLAEFVRTRGEVPPPIAAFVAGLPRHVSAAVDAMVDPDPARRPRSARVAVALLREGRADAAMPRLPWIGDDAAVRAVVEAVRSARSVDVAGPAGCGRSRTLQEAERRLVAEGFRVVRSIASAEPFGSVLPAVGASADDHDEARRAARVRRALGAALAARVAVFADDWDELDRASRELLDELRDHGPVVRVLDGAVPGAIVPPPVSEEELRPLFRGPDRFFHLREDGARELHRRTGGTPGAVAREIDAWIEAGIARFEDGQVVVERNALERLEAPFAVALPRRDAVPGRFSASALDVAGVLEVAGCPLGPAVIADLLDLPVARVRREIGALVDEHVVRLSGAGEAVPLVALGASVSWTEERLRAVHDAAACAPSSPAELRIHHLLGAARPGEAAGAACRLAEREFAAGRLSLALTALHEAVRALHAIPDPSTAQIDGVAGLVVAVALGAGTQDVLRTACWELARIEQRTPVLEELECVARAALLTVEGQPTRALAVLGEVANPSSADVERLRNTVRVFASRRTRDHDLRRSALREVGRWARRRDDPHAHAFYCECLAWERYAQGRFRASALLQARAARRDTTWMSRVSATLNAASAALEAGELGWACHLASDAHAQAVARRHPLHETRAWTVLRCAAYRRGDSIEPDLDAVQELTARVPPLTSAIAFLNEAAAAWRLGRLEIAGRIAAAAAAQFDRARSPGGAALARALAHVAAGPGVREPPPAVPASEESWANVRLQALALLAPLSDVEVTAADVAALRRLSPTRCLRREVLGDDEILARLAMHLGPTDLEPDGRVG